ncbi:hypothetical protein MLD38_001430 [Melastoma candidum]|uniref:Uncharacterized protein n=2 Tax=Melastoma candidum TaxID=119954 RepID=A0ACB9SCN7_9MYRT|nr:hypothetical protein MLD38_001430 [Melastoma candidum]
MAVFMSSFFFSLAVSISAASSSSYQLVPDNLSFDLQQLDSNSGGLRLRNSSSFMSTGLELTVRPTGRMIDIVGRAMYPTPMRLWDNVTGNTASFTTSFTFSVDSAGNSQHGDGLAFFLVPNGSYDPPNNSQGGNLGLIDANKMNGTLPPSAAFVAVEVDTFYNLSNPWDPLCLHIGIDVNNITSVEYTCVDWLEDKVELGGIIRASITYDSSTGNLSAVLSDANSPNNSSTVSHVVELKQYLPEEVVIGFTATTGWFFELHTIHSWDFRSNIMVAVPYSVMVPAPAPDGRTVPNTNTKQTMAVILAISIVGGGLLVGLVLGLIWRRLLTRKVLEDEGDDMMSIDREFGEVAGPKRYSYEELVEATDDFSEDRLLGRGGFGKVYEGKLRETGSRVAIKRISPESKQGVKEYATEVTTISQLRHRNLVQLFGWCHKRNDLLLIYEFMSNGSLDSHLFYSHEPLKWETRYQISRDVASALLYLHEGWERCVIHRDIKCSNIMLDSDFCAKLGDFGLARLVDHSKGSRTTVTAGTFGYMAPESFYSGKSSKESDVYSFGVVLLELVCGRKVVDTSAGGGRENLVDWVRELHRNGTTMDALDESLEGNFDPMEAECVLTVGLWCTHPNLNFRPSIREAIATLQFDSLLPAFPPTFWDERYARNPSLPPSVDSSSTTTGNRSTFSIETSTMTTSSTEKSCSSSSALLMNTD